VTPTMADQLDEVGLHQRPCNKGQIKPLQGTHRAVFLVCLQMFTTGPAEEAPVVPTENGADANGAAANGGDADFMDGWTTATVSAPQVGMAIFSDPYGD
jgi:hypothetical protein